VSPYSARAALPFLFALTCMLTFHPCRTPAQTRHRISSDRNRFLIEDLGTQRTRPFDMWFTRLANALMDVEATDGVIAQLDDYRRYGVNTIQVGIQGGNLGANKNHLYPVVYNADGTLKLASVVWGNLDRLLAETDRRGMVLNIQYWYHLRDENVPDDQKAIEITRAVTQWLKNTGRRNYMLDVVNEFDHNAFQVPGQPSVKRPLFSTLEGALTLLEAVYDVDPSVIAGMSAPGALLCPEGYLDNPPRGKRWVEAGVIYGHNQVADPLNPYSYRLGSVPKDPRSKPLVYSEFNLQLRYEHYPQINPRTQLLSYGHWDQNTITLYVADMKLVRAYGGYANVFSHFHQYVAPSAVRPESVVGPEGTQPEATAGGGEPSLHWAYTEVARQSHRLPLAQSHDFAEGAPGVETELAGAWQRRNERLEQTSATVDPAYARLTAPDGDVEVSLEAGFTAPPGPNGRLGIQLGAASPAGPAYRLLAEAGKVTLDQIGGKLEAKNAPVPPFIRNQYILRLARGRISLRVNGTTAVDVVDPSPLSGRNLLFLTRNATAQFDNVRVSPLRYTDFDDSTTGIWQAVEPTAWSIVTASGPDRVWQAEAPTNEERHAALDRRLGNVALDLNVDVSQASAFGIGMRVDQAATGGGSGYYLTVTRAGSVTLERRPSSGPATPLGATTVPSMKPEDVRIRVTLEDRRVVVRVDGRVVLDVVDTSVEAPTEGGLTLIASSGRVRFDDLDLTVVPNRMPVVRFVEGSGAPLPAGFAIDFTDPDGLAELVEMKFEVDLGNHAVIDATLLLIPQFGIFGLDFSPDGKGARFTLNAPLPLGAVTWTLRASTRDRWGNTGSAEYRIGQK